MAAKKLTIGTGGGGGTGTIDAVPVDGSTNAVSSNGVFDALSTKAATSHTHIIEDITGLQAALDAKQNVASPVNTQGSIYTPTLDKANGLIRQNDGSANKVIIPSNADVPYPIGISLTIRQAGLGSTSIEAATGVTINGNLTVGGQHKSIVITKVGLNEWDSFGGITLIQLSTPSLVAQVISDTHINVTLGSVSNASSYILEWSPNGVDTWTELATVSGTYSHENLTPETIYYYRAKAIGNGVFYSDSEYATANGTTLAEGSSNTGVSAEFDGPNGTLLSAYVPESGSFTEANSGFTLNGSGKLVLPAAVSYGTFKVPMSSPNFTLEATFDWIQENGGFYVIFRDTAQTTLFFNVNVDNSGTLFMRFVKRDGTNYTPYSGEVTVGQVNAGKVLTITANGSTISATMGTYSTSHTTDVLELSDVLIQSKGVGTITLERLVITEL